jgi:YidC/Oxa1 family membrane protein insertase
MSKQRRVQLLLLTVVLVFALSACSGATSSYESPIGAEGVGWAWFQWIVQQVANLTVWISELVGGYYWVGLVVVTLLVRTAGWPIYAKSNQMTVKMQQAQPAMDAIKEKYKGRNDEASQRKMQMETMAVYKEYGINPLGCLLPFLQMPIFISMYQVVRRIPITDMFNAGGEHALKFNFLWVKNLGEADPYYILPILVGLVMFFSQQYTMKKPDYLQNKKYTKTDQQKQSEGTMKIMSYVMVVMLVSIALTNAGIALYWIIGTSYQFLQTYLNRRKSAKQFEMRR